MKVGLLPLLAFLALAICLPFAATAGTDTDGDTIPDSSDNCPTIANAGQADGDSDEIGDVCDNCSTIPSNGTIPTPDASQNPPVVAVPFGVNYCDIDSDGYGGPCDCDVDNDFICQITDFGVMSSLLSWGLPDTPSRPTDLDCDGITQITDFGFLGLGFGMPPGPSGLACAGSGGGPPAFPICTP